MVFQIKLWSHCVKLLKKNRSGRQAAALSYHTLFGLVPLAIVMLLIFQSFPAYSAVGQKVKGLVYEELRLANIEYTPDETKPEETVELTDELDKIVGKFFAGVNTGSIGILSVVIVIWAALALLSTVEKAFNNIWHVSRGRGFIHRIINYWALVTLGPLLVGVGIYLATQNSALGQIQKTVMSAEASVVLSYFVAVAAFFLLYFVLPNTRVEVGSAIWGAAVAALVWMVVKTSFGYYVTQWKPYSTVYGAMALIPITVLWIYVTWLIVLFGLQLTYTTQHLHRLDAAEIASTRKTEEFFIANDFTVINILREIAAAFEADESPLSADAICSKLDIPPEFGDKILNHLVNRALIVRTSEPSAGYVPAKDPANIRLSDIAEAVAAVGFAQSPAGRDEQLVQIAQSQRSVLSRYSLKEILTRSQTQ